MISMTRRSAPTRIRALFLGLTTIALSSFVEPVNAQQTYPPAVEDQCRDDYFRFCSSYALGSTELRRCMESKGRTLSSNCQQALKDAGFVKTSKSK